MKYRVLVNIGSFVPEKNHEKLLNVFEAVAKKDASVFLIIIGDGPLRSELENKVNGLACKDRVLFAGFRNDVLQVLKHSTAFLMPSLIEGLPGVILEAMYCQTPVVANNVGGISEVVNDETGWLIEKGDTTGFINAVNEVLMGGKQVNAKVNSAYQLVTSTYMNSQIALRFFNMYTDIVANHKTL